MPVNLQSVSGLMTGLQQASKLMQRLPSDLERALIPASKLGREFGSFSTALSTLFDKLGGVSSVLEDMRNNRNFHLGMLKMEMNGSLQQGEAAQLAPTILQVAGDSLQSSAAVQDGAEVYLGADMPLKKVQEALVHAASTASALFTDTKQVSQFDVSAEKKLGIAPTQFSEMHNGLLHYSRKVGDNDGALLQAAPRVFSTMADSGLKGREAVHLLGAWGQQMMQRDPDMKPQQAMESLQKVLERLGDPKVVADLKRQGVAVDSLMPKGVLGGVDAAGKPVGGQQAVDALLNLLGSLNAQQQAMLLPGAGHGAERAAMGDVKGLKQSMQEGEAASKRDLVGAALVQIKESSFGKVKVAEVARDRLSLSPAATAVTEAHANLSQFAGENPGTAAAVVGAGIWEWNRLKNGKALSKSSTERAVIRGAGQLAILAAPLAIRAVPVAAAGAAGYAVGSAVDAGITKVLTATNDGKKRTLGTWLYDLIHGDEDAKLLAPTPIKRNARAPDGAVSLAGFGAPALPQLALLQAVMESSTRLNLAANMMQQASQQPIPLHVTVDVQNGNIVAAVNQANKLELRRN